MRNLLLICVLITLPLEVLGQTMGEVASLQSGSFVLAMSLSVLALLFAANSIASRRMIRALRDTHQRSSEEDKKAKEGLEEQNVILLQRIAAMEAAMYEVSHDLSSPLVSISGFARSAILAQSRGQTDQIVQYLERVEASAGSMSSLVQVILSVSRIGQEVPETRGVFLSDIVRALQLRLDHLLAPKGIQLICAHDMYLVTDPGMLSRALQNYVENAAIHGCGPDAPIIRVEALRGVDQVRISVTDSGPGIPIEVQPHLFALFQRGDADGQGRGLGLTIASRLAVRLGGRTGFESEAGRETVFWISVPDHTAINQKIA